MAHSNNGDVIENHGQYDYWLLKLDSLGTIQWQKAYGGTNEDYFGALTKTTDGGYALVGSSGSFNGNVSANYGNNDIWIVKVDSLGNIQWEKNYGGSAFDYAQSIVQTMDGGYVIAGATASVNFDVTFNNGDWDLWVIKIDSVGNIQWQKCLGGTDTEFGNSIIICDNGYLVAGYSKSNDGDVSLNKGDEDIWLIKLDFNGNLIWEKSFGGSGEDVAFCVQMTSFNGCIIAGWTNSSDGDVLGNHGDYDYWILNLDSSGNIFWQKTFGGSSSDKAIFISPSHYGFIITGESSSIDGDLTSPADSMDVWVLQIDSMGNIIWDGVFGGSNYDAGDCIKEVTPGNFIQSGYSYSNDGDVTGNNGESDYWISKLTQTFNTITGIAYLDLNNNLLNDVFEPSLDNLKFTESTTQRIGVAGNNGNYNISVLTTGNFITEPDIINHYTSNPTFHSSFFNNLNEIDSLNHFAFQPNGIINDLKISISPLNAFRPGFDAHYSIYYKNIGTTNHSGTIIFYPDLNSTFISSSINPLSITADSIVWATNTLAPFDDVNILVTINVNSTTSIGTIINATAIVEPIAGDADATNNTSTWDVAVTGSFDPNDILVNRETFLTTELINPPYLDYIIRFQNTGNDTAFTVKIKNPLPINSQINSFEYLEASHPVQLNYNNFEHTMWFNFNNILLPDSNTNELLSHGFVRYKIKPLSNLLAGDSVLNNASIYFDFNAPVITNTAVTEIVLPNSIPENSHDFNLKLFPNPVNNELNILFILNEKASVVLRVVNNLGQIVYSDTKKEMPIGNNKYSISTENLPGGIYHLQLIVDKQSATRKPVKID